MINPEDSYFESVSVAVCDTGWQFDGAFNANTLVNCAAQLCHTAGARTLDSASNVWVGGVIQSNECDGIRMEAGVGWLFLGTHFENNNSCATSGKNAVTMDGAPIEQVSFRNCRFATRGIRSTSTAGPTVRRITSASRGAMAPA